MGLDRMSSSQPAGQGRAGAIKSKIMSAPPPWRAERGPCPTMCDSFCGRPRQEDEGRSGTTRPRRRPARIPESTPQLQPSLAVCSFFAQRIASLLVHLSSYTLEEFPGMDGSTQGCQGTCQRQPPPPRIRLNWGREGEKARVEESPRFQTYKFRRR